jgi:uncharacterized membrane protein
MPSMKPSTRLIWCAVIIVGSAIYGLLIAYNPRVATAIMVGYIALLLTILVVIHVWKKPTNGR